MATRDIDPSRNPRIPSTASTRAHTPDPGRPRARILPARTLILLGSALVLGVRPGLGAAITLTPALKAAGAQRPSSVTVRESSHLVLNAPATPITGIPDSADYRWDGRSTSGSGARFTYIRTLAADGKGGLYASGTFVAPDRRVGHVAAWDGTGWSSLGPELDGCRFNTALAVDGGGNLYVGDVTRTEDGMLVDKIARWNGTSWAVLDSWGHRFVEALAVDHSGNLYAGGSYNHVGGEWPAMIARWNGTSWSELSPRAHSGVHALVVGGDGSLYAGGFFTDDWVTGNLVVKWNGSGWSPLGPESHANNQVWALAVDGKGNLYAGGMFTDVGGVSANHIARWNGTSWSALGTGVNGPVRALAVDGDGNLYAGGLFTTTGGVSANHIARWNGTSWSPLGSGAGGMVFALLLDRGGSLYAGGFFGTAGHKPSSSFAVWNGGSLTVAPAVASQSAFRTEAWPNPFTGQVTIAFSASAPTPVRLEVLDVAGRRVWSSPENFVGPGPSSLTWDGRADRAADREPGIYFLRVRGPGVEVTRRVVRIR